MLKQQHQQRRQRIQLQGLNRKRTLKYLMIALLQEPAASQFFRAHANTHTIALLSPFFSAVD